MRMMKKCERRYSQKGLIFQTNNKNNNKILDIFYLQPYGVRCHGSMGCGGMTSKSTKILKLTSNYPSIASALDVS
jgi:hypothetical protein